MQTYKIDLTSPNFSEYTLHAWLKKCLLSGFRYFKQTQNIRFQCTVSRYRGSHRLVYGRK